MNRRYFKLRVKLGSLIELSIELLRAFLTRRFPDVEPFSFLTDTRSKDSELYSRMWKLALSARSNRAGRGALRSRSLSSIMARLESTTHGKRWLSTFNELLEEYGDLSAAKWDVMSSTLREEPELLLNAVKALVKEGARMKRASSAERVIEEIASKLEGDERTKFLTLVDAVRKNYALKEDRDFYYFKSLAALRRALLNAGERLVRRGVIEEDEDVFFFTVDGLLEVLSSAEKESYAVMQMKREKLLYRE